MRYLEKQIVFSEVPEEISLSYLVTGCPLRCRGCHSADSWNSKVGQELTLYSLEIDLLKYKTGITCVLFMGGEWEPESLVELLQFCRLQNLKTALYTGSDDVSDFIKQHLDYLKTGPFIGQLGGLENPNTNQILWYLPTMKKLNFYFTQHLQGGRNDTTERSSTTQ